MVRRTQSCSIGSVFLAVALLLAALGFAKGASFFAGPARARNIIAQASALSRPDPAGVQPYLDEAKKTAEALKKQNLFVKQPPKANPVKQVEGILGSEVLIGGKWYKVGDKIGDAKVISIEPTEVTIEWDGRQTSFAPMAGTSTGGPEPPRPPGSAPSAKAASVAKPTPRLEVAEVRLVAAPQGDDPFAWMGVNLSEKARAMLQEKWNSMSDEQKEDAKREWNSMSDEQKQKAAESFEKM